MLIKLKADFMNQKAGQVVEANDSEAEVLISKGIAEKSSEDAITAIVTKASDALMTKVNDSVSKIIDATLKQFLEAQSQAKKFAMPAIFGQNGDGDPKKNFGPAQHPNQGRVGRKLWPNWRLYCAAAVLGADSIARG
jgi:hypothetical protein